MKNALNNAPEGATHILNDKFYMKWVDGIEHIYLNGAWRKAQDGWSWSLKEWQHEYKDRLKELDK